MPTRISRRKLLGTGTAALVLPACSTTAQSRKAGSAPAERHAPVELPFERRVRPPEGFPVLRAAFEPLNVIVVMLDSFRADHLGALGGQKAKTPHLDRFAADATLFTRSYPEGLPTIPARTSLMTGRFTYPFRGWQALYPEDGPLLQEILWSNGFTSCLVSDTYHMHKPGYGFGRGFDDVHWIRGQEGDPFVRDPRVEVDVEPFFKPRTGAPGESAQTRQYLRNRHHWKTEDDQFAPRVFAKAADWLRRQKKRDSLFLWVDSFSPHEPWDPPDRYLKMYAPNYQGKRLVLPVPGDMEGYLDAAEQKNLAACYAAVVTFIDACVGRLLDELKRLDLYDRSLILIMTDHGEPFGEHGIVRKVRPWPYEELAHTWLIARYPGGKGVKKVESYIQQTDMTATILEYAGIRTPERMTSESLLPLILGRKDKIRDAAVCCHHTGGWSIRSDDWSYHYYLPGIARTAKNSKLSKSGPELYNLRADPGERNNLATAEPDRARAMDQMLFDFTRRLKDHAKAT